MAKVLIVEDEPLVARMYEKSLKFEGIDVVTALGGKEGLEKVKSEAFDLVICDIMMPEPNGIDVLTAIKEDPDTQNIPVIMLTNLSGTSDAKLAMSKGAVDYWVKKDTDIKELGQKIKDVLAKTSNTAPEANTQPPQNQSQ